MENFSLNRCHLNLMCMKFSKRCTCCDLPKMNECIVLSKYRHLIPHEVFFKSISGTKKRGANGETWGARESFLLPRESLPHLVLSGAHITLMGLLRWRRKTLRGNRRTFSDFFTCLVSMLKLIFHFDQSLFFLCFGVFCWWIIFWNKS